MREQITVNVPKLAILDDEGMGGAVRGYFIQDGLSGMAYGSAGSVRKSLREAAAIQINDALEHFNSQRGAVLMCGDGTALIVAHQNGGWGYHITGPDRKQGACSCLTGRDFEEASDRARNHAAQSFGSVVWECGF